MRVGFSVAALGLTLGARAARAEDPPSPVYPAELTARPLLLPDGGIEGGVEVLISRSDTIDSEFGDTFTSFAARPHARIAFGATEVEGDVELFLGDDQENAGDRESIPSASLAVRRGLAPDLTIALAVTAYRISDGPVGWAPAAVLTDKVHLAPRSAVQLQAQAGFERTSFDDGGGTSSFTQLVMAVGAEVQAQVSPVVALQGRGQLTYLRDLDSGEASFFSAYLLHTAGVGLVAAVTPGIDVTAGLDIQFTGDQNGKLFTVGLRGRRFR